MLSISLLTYGINNDNIFYQNDFIAFILKITALICIVIFIQRLKRNADFNKKVRFKGGYKRLLENLLAPLKDFYNLEPDYSGQMMTAGPFKAFIKHHNLCFVWNNEVMWEFDVLKDNCDRNFMYEMGKEVIVKIIQYQSLSKIKEEPSQQLKLTMIKRRLYAYDYEETLYEIFSKKTEYSEDYGYSSFYYPIDHSSFLEEIIIRNNLSFTAASDLIREFETNGLIMIIDGKVYLGTTLDLYWWIISKEDNNFNRWCWNHNIKPLRKVLI